MKLDPDLAKALAEHPAITSPRPCPEGVSQQEFARQLDREILTEAKNFHRQRLPPESQYTVKDSCVAVEGGEIPVRCIIPSGGANEMYPVFVFFHGGGFVTGDLDQDDYQLRSICVELQVVVVNVGLAPEHRFPIAFNDCYAALDWVANHAVALRASLTKGFIVGGDSAGANLTAGVVLKARDDPFFSGKRPTGQYLREPALVHPECHPDQYKSELKSLSVFTDTPILSEKGVFAAHAIYNPQPPHDLRMSPLLAPLQAGLPAAFFQIMENDPLRDEGILYEKLLREAGVRTKLILHEGLVHASHYWFPNLPCTLQVDQGMRDGLRWLLSLTRGS